jgi:hypothetical protein
MSDAAEDLNDSLFFDPTMIGGERPQPSELQPLEHESAASSQGGDVSTRLGELFGELNISEFAPNTTKFTPMSFIGTPKNLSPRKASLTEFTPPSQMPKSPRSPNPTRRVAMRVRLNWTIFSVAKRRLAWTRRQSERNRRWDPR